MSYPYNNPYGQQQAPTYYYPPSYSGNYPQYPPTPQQQPYSPSAGYPPASYGQPSPYSCPPQTSYVPNSSYANSQLRKIFDAWDKDHNGYIDPQELSNALRQLGEDNSPETVSAIIKLYDKNGDGVIEFDEFEDLYKYIQEMRRTFNAGKNQSHEITYDKAHDVLSRTLHGPALIAAPALLYTLWKMFDKHVRPTQMITYCKNSGKLNWKQFLLLALELKALQHGYETGAPKPKRHGLISKVIDSIRGKTY